MSKYYSDLVTENIPGYLHIRRFQDITIKAKHILSCSFTGVPVYRPLIYPLQVGIEHQFAYLLL